MIPTRLLEESLRAGRRINEVWSKLIIPQYRLRHRDVVCPDCKGMPLPKVRRIVGDPNGTRIIMPLGCERCMDRGEIWQGYDPPPCGLSFDECVSRNEREHMEWERAGRPAEWPPRKQEDNQ